MHEVYCTAGHQHIAVTSLRERQLINGGMLPRGVHTFIYTTQAEDIPHPWFQPT